jgi:hypothetical protein
MVDLAEKHPRVAIVGAYEIHGAHVAADGVPYPNTVVTGREICRVHLLGGPYVFGTPTTVLFRSDIVRSRHDFFNASNLHADDEACIEFLEHADFGFVQQILTYRHVEEGSLTSFSARFNTYVAGLLYLLVTYGPKYLTQEELERRTREVLRQYYRSLARGALTARDAAFWNYHRGKLAQLGYPLNTMRLARAVVSLGLDMVLDPKRSVQKISGVLRERAGARAAARG